MEVEDKEDFLKGFIGTGDFCVDDNECLSTPCAQYAVCNNTIGSFDCFCPEGFSGDGNLTCTDDNECVDFEPCHSNATCANNIGSFECTCLTGYNGDGIICIDIDECDTQEW